MHDDRRPARFFLRALGTAAAYAGCAWLSQEVVYGHTDACALWPAAGVGLAAVLLFGRAAGALGTFIGSLVGVSLFFGSRLGPEADQTHVSLVDERGRLERVPRPLGREPASCRNSAYTTGRRSAAAKWSPAAAALRSREISDMTSKVTDAHRGQGKSPPNRLLNLHRTFIRPQRGR